MTRPDRFGRVKQKGLGSAKHTRRKNQLHVIQDLVDSKNHPEKYNIRMRDITEVKSLSKKLVSKVPNLKSELELLWHSTTDLDDFINKSIDAVGMSNLINEEDQINFGGLTWGCSSGGYGPGYGGPEGGDYDIGQHHYGNNHSACLKFLIMVIVIIVLL